ncbi:MAG: Veg family protein [Lachnospiraceae bacterium]|nr:Veg family protein [Lachnospiraceae bacterium]
MAAEQQVLDKIRASVTRQLGNTVQIKQDEGRHRTNVCEGVLKNAYPSVFTVMIKGKGEEPDQMLSFSYSDIVTKVIRMRLCETA